MERPLRLIPTEVTPAAELARTVEALLVVASQPLSIAELMLRPRTTRWIRSRTRSSCSPARYAEGRSGIVLEHVAGGFAFRAAAESLRGVRAPVREAGREGALSRRHSRRSRSSPTSAR